jgi:FkbM family methyltransferase
MSTSLFFAHPRLIAWRNHLRKSSLLRDVYRGIAGRGAYEARFARDLLAAVRPGDTVWDVGANVGVYAAQFAERGAANVICFEPAPAALAALRDRFSQGSQIRIMPIALGKERGTVSFAADGASPNNQIGPSDSSLPTIEIEVRSGDEALTEFGLPHPEVIKIDVEGYELEVVEGLSNMLSSGKVRSVFIEVHFALLHGRKLDHAPGAILQKLRQHGFSVRWVDPSHIGAHRT